MRNHQYIGFSPSQLIKMQNLVTKAEKAISAASSGLNALRPSWSASAAGPVNMAVKEWFGSVDRAAFDIVCDTVQMMHFGISGTKLVFTYNGTGCTPTMFAMASPPTGGWGRQNPKQLAANTYKMSVCASCLTSGEDHAGKIGPLGTLVHELSHLFGNTNDICTDMVAGVTAIDANPTGDPYYDIRYAKDLATNRPDLAVHNAENFGLFITKRFVAGDSHVSIGSLFG